MILVDSNIPMCLVGAPSDRKVDAQRALERLTAGSERLVTDAEVLQEILHRYVAIDRRDAIQPTFDALLQVVDEVLPIEVKSALRAREIVLASRVLSARDAIHVAVTESHGIRAILSFDRGFDAVPGIERLS